MARGNRIAWGTLVPLMRLLSDVVVGKIEAPITLRVQCAEYLADRCLGKPAVHVESTSTVDITLDASRLQQALDQARLAVLQAQDTARQALPPAPLDTATTPE